ncbi:MAG: metallophosphoesterase family protein [Clostridia bacterium]|nr:metallophosphoesterase family protein [Clostridia bacterium]
MPTLILTDIHGNLPALEAVLAHPAARRCTEIISLGDHVNFGPQSRAVHERLCSLDAVMLLGNHEERLTRPADAEFDGYNWRLMRWTARQLRGFDLHLPTDLRRGNVLFTHGTPGDPYHLVQPDEVPALLDTLPEGVTLLLSGHNHTPWDVARGGRRWVNPGSAGMRELIPGTLETGSAGIAPFLVLEDGEPTQHAARYSVADVARAYVETGACREAPELCRAVLHVMQTAQPQGALALIRHVSAIAARMGLTLGDEAAWKAADRTYPWAESMTSEEYWKHMEESL